MNDLIIYNTDDGKSHVALLVVENEAWLTQNQLAELFDTSVQNITTHIKNILQDKELDEFSVIKDYLNTAFLAVGVSSRLAIPCTNIRRSALA